MINLGIYTWFLGDFTKLKVKIYFQNIMLNDWLFENLPGIEKDF
jgi:hypothetical protein